MNKGMLIAPLAALLLVACSDDGENGSNEVDSVVTTRAVAKGTPPAPAAERCSRAASTPTATARSMRPRSRRANTCSA